MLKIVFFGTPAFSRTVLEALYYSNLYEIVGVVTQPDKEVGRKKIIEYSEVKKFAIEKNIKVFQPVKIRKEYQDIIDLKPDLIVTAAYGQIIGEDLLKAPKYQSINVHASLLPLYRGGAPIQRSIMNGDKKTGITIMYMEKGMDTGDILSQRELEIDSNDTSTTLFEKLAVLGARLLLDTIPDLVKGNITPIKQEGNITYAYNIEREEEKLDFNQDAYTLYNKVRALLDEPAAYFNFKGFEEEQYSIKVYEAEPYDIEEHHEIGDIINITKKDFSICCGNHTALKILKLKPNGKNIQSAKDFINGGLKKYMKGE